MSGVGHAVKPPPRAGPVPHPQGLKCCSAQPWKNAPRWAIPIAKGRDSDVTGATHGGGGELRCWPPLARSGMDSDEGQPEVGMGIELPQYASLSPLRGTHGYPRWGMGEKSASWCPYHPLEGVDRGQR